jgi:hypothetical protein
MVPAQKNPFLPVLTAEGGKSTAEGGKSLGQIAVESRLLVTDFGLE